MLLSSEYPGGGSKPAAVIALGDAVTPVSIAEIGAIDTDYNMAAVIPGAGDIDGGICSTGWCLRQIERDRACARQISPGGIRARGQDVIPILRPLAFSDRVVHAVRKVEGNSICPPQTGVG